MSKKHSTKSKEPPLVEGAKGFLFARGMHCSETCKNVMRDIAKLKSDQSKTLSGKNDFHPMEDETPLEHLCRTHGTGLFAFANENKKRPNNILLGRTFDGRILDMVEVGVTKFESMLDCQKRAKTTPASSYAAPLMLFQGEEFANAPEGGDVNTLQSLLMDMFRGRPAKELDLEAIDLALVFTCTPDKKVLMRGYRVTYKKGNKTGSPKIDLIEHGPNIDFEIRRYKAAAPNLAKLARRQPKLPGDGNTKNVSSDPLRGLVGQIHMHKQDTNKLVTSSRFRKALKRKKSDKEGSSKKQKTGE